MSEKIIVVGTFPATEFEKLLQAWECFLSALLIVPPQESQEVENYGRMERERTS